MRIAGPGNVNVTLFGRSLSIVANQSLESVIDCNNSSYAAFYFDNNANATLSGTPCLRECCAGILIEKRSCLQVWFFAQQLESPVTRSSSRDRSATLQK